MKIYLYKINKGRNDILKRVSDNIFQSTKTYHNKCINCNEFPKSRKHSSGVEAVQNKCFRAVNGADFGTTVASQRAKAVTPYQVNCYHTIINV